MNMYRAGGLLLAALLSATAASSDVKGVATPPAFSPEEMQLINRDPRLIGAAKNDPWRLRCALDEWQRSRGPRTASERQKPCLPEEGRASAEAALDLLQILKEAAGQDAKR